MTHSLHNKRLRSMLVFCSLLIGFQWFVIGMLIARGR